MLKKTSALALALTLFSLEAQAGEFLIFPHVSEIDDPSFYKQPFATHPTTDDRSDRCDIIFQGAIQKGDLTNLQRVVGFDTEEQSFGATLSSHSSPTLCLDSPGGDLNEALAMARLLWEASDLTTRITSGDTCASACSFLFLTGNLYEEGENQDQYFHRVLEKGARLGFHAPSLNLGDGGNFSGAQVSSAFDLAMKAAREAFSYGFQTDSDGEPFMGSYLFARFLETPPQDMYYLDTVGDALQSGLPVTGYSVTGPADDAWAKTICDNIFKLDNGHFDWVVGPSWKGDVMMSAKMTEAEFSTWDLRDVSYDAYQQGTYEENRPQTVSSLRDGRTFYGMALSYPTGYPWTFSGCVVSASIPDGSEFFDVTEAYKQIEPTYFDVSVITFNHSPLGQPTPSGTPRSDLSFFEHPDKLSAKELWELATSDMNNGGDAKQKKYPWLITFPFGLPLSSLPDIGTPAAKNLAETSNLTCDQLWYQRNLIFHENGYCFGGARGKSTFGNDGCYADAQTIDLSEDERAAISQFKTLEKEKGC